MISREIEKEIQQENKVILNFTMRQVVCLSVALVFSVLIAVVLAWDFTIAIYPCFVIGGVCFAFGWMKQDGLPMERILVQKLQVHLYKNNVRIYKTKNRYVMMMNREYDRRRAMDSQDKRLQKSVRKDVNRKKKELRSSKLQRIAREGG